MSTIINFFRAHQLVITLVVGIASTATFMFTTAVSTAGWFWMWMTRGIARTYVARGTESVTGAAEGSMTYHEAVAVIENMKKAKEQAAIAQAQALQAQALQAQALQAQAAEAAEKAAALAALSASEQATEPKTEEVAQQAA